MTNPFARAGVRHTVRAHPDSFQPMWDGLQTFDVRENDRDYKVDDSYQVMEFDPAVEKYTGRMLGASLSFILQGKYGLPPNIVVMTLSIWSRIVLPPHDAESITIP